MDASIASSQKPAASSDLALDETAVLRYPFSVIRSPLSVYRPSHFETSKVFTHGSRLYGERTAAKWASQ